jgi:hypothetical protein
MGTKIRADSTSEPHVRSRMPVGRESWLEELGGATLAALPAAPGAPGGATHGLVINSCA